MEEIHIKKYGHGRIRDCCSPILSVSNAFVRKSCGCGECSMFEMFWMRKESLFF